MSVYQTSLVPKLIYVFGIADAEHEHCLKIGDATIEEGFDFSPNSKTLNDAAHKRIHQYTQTAGIQYQLLYTEKADYVKGKFTFGFRDSDVHNVLKRSGIQKKDFNGLNADEWFVTDLATVKNAIQAVKQGKESLNSSQISKDRTPIIFRPEQRDAIDRTVKRFKKGKQMLWNAKMRFGKTLCALQVVKEMNFKRTLILTHRPVVNDGWFKDFGKVFIDREDFFQYGSRDKGNRFGLLERNAKKGQGRYVYFASIQDLRGSEKVGGNFDKNNELFSAEWDCLIVDEAHEGTKTELGQAVIGELTKENTKVLQLSGTPFNLLDEYEESDIYTWDYVMEQKAKAEWDITHKGDPNPYAVLPRLNIYTFDLGKLVRNFSDNDLAFNFHEFFRTDENSEFVHNGEVGSFLNLICKKDEESNYPFSTDEFRRNFRHSLWMLPGVAAAKALSEMLKSHKVFGNFKIVNVAGNGDEDEENDDALKMVQRAIGPDPDETYTITLSCGRLTTGVSVPEWTAVFMLSGSANTSAASYMQTIFRVQTPATINGRVKQECFVFDFAPDRTLKVLAETAKISARAGKTTQADKRIMGEFLNFCPVIGFDGTKMRTFDVEKMLGQLKRVQIERVVRNGFEDSCLYNDELLKLDKIELAEFDNLKRIIGQTRAMKKSGNIDINSSGLTNEEYEDLGGGSGKKKSRDLTPEEKERLEKLKEARKNRDAAASILRGISIRMPLMIYGADLKDESEQINIENFESLVDDTSWAEFMPKGVTKELFRKFKKYYEEDIFREAGKRIREMARAADDLGVEQRIGRVGNIFNSFRNPDKETVLTPWRVVNMHLSESLGGYAFFDESFDSDRMLENPRFVSRGGITGKVFSPESRILEINSKSGLYPLYMAYGIYRAELKKRLGKMTATTVDTQHKIWDKVVSENIFVICKTPMAASITRRTLLGFRKETVNARSFENLETVIAKNPDDFVNRVRKFHFWKETSSAPKNFKEDEMKFDAVVGNPPYQTMANGDANGSDPIYHRFIDVSKKMASLGTLIHPARFLFNAGKTPKDWNEKILNDEHFKVVKYYAKSTDVFPTVDIKGGVAITLFDAQTNFGKIGTFSAYLELSSILKKVVNEKFKTFAELVYPRDLYHLTETLYKENPWAESRPSKGHRYDVGSNIFEIFPELFFDEKPDDGEEYAGILGREKSSRNLKWIKKKYLKLPDNFNAYKVFVPKANGTGAIGEVLSTPVVGRPIVGHTLTFLSIGKFKTKFEAEACLKYIKTRFARTMLGTLKVTQDNPRETWANVPLQDFTPNSDIDWSKSIAEIDAQLNAKYKLNADEITFIRTHVREME